MSRTAQATAGTRPGHRRKVRVASFTWEFPPDPNLFPIFEMVGTRAGVNWKDRTLSLSPEGCDLRGGTWKGYQVAELVARFNAGERWLAKKKNPVRWHPPPDRLHPKGMLCHACHHRTRKLHPGL